MKIAHRYGLLGLVVVLFLALLSGCSGTVGPEPVTGEIKICTDDEDIYGSVFIDDDKYEPIDGRGGLSCTGWITVTLNEVHTLKVHDTTFGITTYDDKFTPTYDGQTIWIGD